VYAFHADVINVVDTLRAERDIANIKMANPSIDELD
jgi:hypothetical protein